MASQTSSSASNGIEKTIPMSSKHIDPLGGFLDDVKGKSNNLQIGCTKISTERLLFDNLPRETTWFMNSKVEMKKTSEAFVYKLEVPGLKEEEVKVEIVENGRVLQISGQRDTRKDDQHVVTTYKTEFLKSFTLPENSKSAATKAYLEFGELTIVVPKRFVRKTLRDLLDFSS